MATKDGETGVMVKYSYTIHMVTLTKCPVVNKVKESRSKERQKYSMLCRQTGLALAIDESSKSADPVFGSSLPHPCFLQLPQPLALQTTVNLCHDIMPAVVGPISTRLRHSTWNDLLPDLLRLLHQIHIEAPTDMPRNMAM